jgi:hypothetical protein
MAYPGTIRRCLISGPSDIPDSDLAVVHKTINHWNGLYGERYESVIIPISWGSHAAAEFGRGPQAILNEQLVDSCDMCIAMFWTRLGTPTLLHESGSAEEIQRLSEQGKYVAILRCTRDFRPSIDIGQLAGLKKYMEKLEKNALILNYEDHADLATHVDNILVRGVNLDLAGPTGARYANVWPRLDKTERNNRSRIYLRLENKGFGTARDVRVEFETNVPGSPWRIDDVLENIDGEDQIILPLRFDDDPPPWTQVKCSVSWSDERGRERNVADLSLALPALPSNSPVGVYA